MKPLAPSQAARELDSITSSFLQLRILRYASTSPANAAVIAHRIRPYAGGANPSRILARMTRTGLLKANAPPTSQARFAPQYFLTPKGRRLLEMARKYLRQLAAQSFINKKQTTIKS